MDFTDNYSPVVNDVTFRVVVARMIVENMKGKVVDIDNAFLNGDLDQSDEVLRRNRDEPQGSLMKGCQMKLKEA